ncbi:E2F-like protein [Pseudoloma neurophilia]|uniref:E2F-like protein n=1 Tax=Pseudoloma neurophilia TaxID=146866 RepID=A0A0R0LS28_9MICR|nr:E2F-like protein [Pseudoloma neurophilia]
MKEIFSDALTSETRKEGLKEISVSIHNLLLIKKNMTYKEILDNINTSNANTLRRRVYDVLSVMRALNMITKDKRMYSLIGRNPISEKRIVISEKKKQITDLKHLKEVFEFIVKKNAYRSFKISDDKFFLPFMVVVIERDSNVHCETNEERSCFKFRSEKPIKLVEDLEILKELHKLNFSPIQNNSMDSLEKFKESFGTVFEHLE